MDAPFLLYGFGLAAAMAAATLTVLTHPDRRLASAAIAVFVNWVAGTLFVLVTEVSDAWLFNIVIDALAAGVILYRLASSWQVALGLTYCLQIAMHVGYGMIVKEAAAPWPYYSALTAIAWLQLLLLLGWSGDIWLRQPPRDRQS